MAFTLHDSWEPESPLKRSLPTGASKPGLEARRGEIVVVKHVNGAFFGTDLEMFWPYLRNRVTTYADLRPELVGAVEQLLDFVTPV